MKLKLNIQRDIHDKIKLQGSKLILPMHLDVVEVYKDVTLFEPDDSKYVVAVHHHVDDDLYSAVYFCFDDGSYARKARFMINQCLDKRKTELVIDDAVMIEVENYNDMALPRHQVTHYNLLTRERQSFCNPFQRERVA
ncbi:hypothetical protein [Cysteiniphilum marinum]|uniref:hypothetical protein n=1 Tax=Cysteiniphilum marinum TaxID=2774191 RepID=UPI001939DC06|nr:hypothetical protein [Cysteiniphilum marinum]